MIRWAVFIGAVFGGLGVGLGAYQAHGLEKSLQAAALPDDEIVRRLHNAQVAVQYLMIHALALVAVGGLTAARFSRCCSAAIFLFVTGSLLFSGGLAVHALTGRLGHWAIVPGGGLLLILGWIALAAHACCCWPAIGTDSDRAS